MISRSAAPHEEAAAAASIAIDDDEPAEKLRSLCHAGLLQQAFPLLLRLSTMEAGAGAAGAMCFLKACIRRKDLFSARKACKHIMAMRRDSDPPPPGVLGDYLVVTLAKCGDVEEAARIWGALPCRTVFSCTAIISAYADRGHGHRALQIYRSMLLREGLDPDPRAFVSLFRACASTADARLGKQLHSQARCRGFSPDPFVANALISMYAKCGLLRDAEDVFGSMPERDVVSWNAMLSAYAEQCGGGKGLRLFRQMLEEGEQDPDPRTLTSALQALGCHHRSAAMDGAVVVEKAAGDGDHRRTDGKFGEHQRADGKFGDHQRADGKFGDHQRTDGKCGDHQRTDGEFGDHQRADGKFGDHQRADGQFGDHQRTDGKFGDHQRTDGEFGDHQRADGQFGDHQRTDGKFGDNQRTDGKCGDHQRTDGEFGDRQRTDGKFGDHQRTDGEFGDDQRADGKFGDHQRTDGKFGDHQRTDGKFGDHQRTDGEFGDHQRADGQFGDHQRTDGKFGDHRDFSIEGGGLRIGRALHAYARRKGLLCDAFVGNALVRMYGRFGRVDEAESVLAAMGGRRRDVVSWTSMLSACSEQGRGEKGLLCYMKMLGDGVDPDELAFVAALQACSALIDSEDVCGRSGKDVALEMAGALEADLARKGFALDATISNTLMSLYGKCGAVAEAEEVFARIPCPDDDAVTWSVMLSVYADNGLGDKALCLYKRFVQGFRPKVVLNEAALMCVLQACCETGSLATCEEVHFALAAEDYDGIPFVSASLIHAYGGCGCMPDAHYVLDQIHGPDIVAWTSCCAGDAEARSVVSSGGMFASSLVVGIHPDEAMFSSVLTACSHGGLVDAGLRCFVAMREDYGMLPNARHYAVLLDLLGRSGRFALVESILKRMPVVADLSLWLGLLGAAGRHGHLDLAEQVFDKALVLQPEEATTYVMMSNIYAHYYDQCGENR